MQRVNWRSVPDIPTEVAESLSTLTVSRPPTNSTLYFLNRHQLTLLAGVNQYAAANRKRLESLQRTCDDVLALLHNAGIEAVLLKGFARAAEYVPDPWARMHYDIDLYCPHQAEAAREMLERAGYRSLPGGSANSAGHLAPLVRPTSWKWHGDFFDPDIPAHIEIHTALWVPHVEGFDAPGIEEFWERREVAGGYLTLSRHDTLAFRCLHALRHLLRGDTRASTFYEIAWFLNQNAADEEFWAEWRRLYAPQLQRIQCVAFAVAARWFNCRLPFELELSAAIEHWMQHHAAAPIASFFKPNKQELLLHFALLDSTRARLRVARRRLLPLTAPMQMWETRTAYAKRLLERSLFHLKTLSNIPSIRRRYTPSE